MANKKTNENYYMEEGIAKNGVIPTGNPAFLNNTYQPFEILATRQNIGNYFDSDSKYDEVLGNIEDAYDLGLTVNDLRANAQTGADMIANALTNNIVIAGTTAVSGTVGLVDGILESLATGDISKMWDNATTNAMVDILDKAKELMPIYRGTLYENMSLLDKLGTGIFWADLVENLGFTEGMLIPGMGISKLLSSAPKMLRMIIPSFVSSMGEGAQEAITNRNLEVEEKTALAVQRYNELLSTAYTFEERQLLLKELNLDLQEIKEDATNGGNFVYGANIALLSLTNSIEFGNLFSRGFNTANRLKGALYRLGEKYAAHGAGYNIAKATAKKGIDAFSEGFEEVSQAIISNTPLNFLDYNRFNESQFNPEKRLLAADLISALGLSYAQTMNDPRTAEEFASGFLIGLIGVPTLRKGVVPIKLENNALTQMYDAYKDSRRAQLLANTINQRLSDSKQVNAYYNGLVRRLSLQEGLSQSLDLLDVKSYKDSESVLFHSDIRMFDEAGDLNRLREIINNSVDMSDEGIQNLIDSTSENGEGPFMQNGNRMSNDEVRQIIQDKLELLNNKIESYLKNKDFLQRQYPNMDLETLDNILFLKEQFADLASRIDSVSNTVSKKINDSINQSGDILGEDAKKFNITPKNLRLLYATNEEYRNNLDALIEADPLISFEEKQELKLLLLDVVKLYNSMIDINKNIADLILHPNKSKQQILQTINNTLQLVTQQKTEAIKSQLSQALSLQDMLLIMNLAEDPNNAFNALLELQNEGNGMSKDYQEVMQYSNEVSRVLDNSTADSSVIEDAKELFNNLIFVSLNLQDVANPNSVHINDDTIFDESSMDSETSKNRFRKALYELLKAMSLVNNDNRFKDRFSDEYKKPPQNLDGTAIGIDDSTTGDSLVATVPVTKPTTIPLYELPTGDVSTLQVKDENIKLSNVSQTLLDIIQLGLNRFYFPAIPKFHIEASKSGDFRPFDVVVAEREGADFKDIYDYFVLEGTFEYLDDGKLHEEDIILFMIDPEFEERVKDKSWHFAPVVFMVTKNGLIVGSLSDANVDKYVGLKDLLAKVRYEYTYRVNESNNLPTIHDHSNEYGYKGGNQLRDYKNSDNYTNVNAKKIIANYNAFFDVLETNPNLSLEEYNAKVNDKLSEDAYRLWKWIQSNLNNYSDNKNTPKQNQRFVATPTTKVSKIMVGKVPYSNEEKSLKDIPNITDSSKKPIFAIVKNGVLVTNSLINSNDIIHPLDMNTPGRLYLLIPNGAGKYSPMAVRVKHFNSLEFDVKEASVADTPIGKAILDAFNKLAQVTSQEDVNLVENMLMDCMYLGHGAKSERDINIEYSEDTHSIIIKQKVKKPDGTYETFIYQDKEYIKEDSYDVNLNLDLSSIQLALISIFTSFNLPIQVSTGKINTAGYNERLINSDVLTSNITKAKSEGTWFTTDIIDSSGIVQPAINPESNTRGQVSLGAITGTPITSIFSRRTYYIDLKTNTIRDNLGRVVPLTDLTRPLLALAWALENYGDATEAENMIDNKIITPAGRVLDRTNLKFLSNEEAQKVKDAIDRRNNPQPELQQYPDNKSSIVPSIFNTELDGTSSVNRVNEQYKIADNDNIGYYEVDGTIYQGYLSYLTEIDGITLFITKDIREEQLTGGPNGDNNFRQTLQDYYVVFPNGKTFKILSNNPISGPNSLSQFGVETMSIDALKKNPDRVKLMSEELTAITRFLNLQEALSQTTTKQGITLNQTLSAQKEQEILESDDEFEDDLRLRETVKNSTYQVWDKAKELAWLENVLPLLNKLDRVRIVEGLINVAKNGALAWGLFDGSIMTLSDIAAEGTTYHEAFHVVFNLLLYSNERQSLLKEYRQKYSNLNDIELEEELAEDFREFVMQGGKDTRSLGRKIIDFFKSLFIKTKYWKNFRPSSIYYFRKINEGKYSDRELGTTKLTRQRNEEYTQEMKDILAKASRDNQGRLLAPNDKPSNLTEKQYAQVRTKAFKEWFGDWENDPANTSKVVDENGEPLVVYRGINDNNYSKLYAYFTNSKKEAEIYSRGLLTKGGYFFKNNKDVIFSIRNYIKNKYNIDQIDDDILIFIIEDYENNGKEFEIPIYENVEVDTPFGFPDIESKQVGVRKEKYISKYSESDYNKAIKDYNKLKNATDELKELLDIIRLINNTTITDESQLTRQYDDIFYIRDNDKLNKLLDKYSDVINNNKNNFKYVIQEVFLNIRNPYVDEINSEDLLSNNKAYSNNHDGALLMQGEHFLVKNNSNQIKSATDNVGTFSTTNDDIRYRLADGTIRSLLSLKTTNTITTFDSLSLEVQNTLLKKGWTKELFDSVSLEERDYTIKCIAF